MLKHKDIRSRRRDQNKNVRDSIELILHSPSPDTIYHSHTKSRTVKFCSSKTHKVLIYTNELLLMLGSDFYFKEQESFEWLMD